MRFKTIAIIAFLFSCNSPQETVRNEVLSGFEFSLFGFLYQENSLPVYVVDDGYCKINLKVSSRNLQKGFHEMLVFMNPNSSESNLKHLLNYGLQSCFSLVSETRHSPCVHYQAEPFISDQVGQNLVLWFKADQFVSDSFDIAPIFLKINDPIFNHQNTELPLLLSLNKNTHL